MKNRRVVLNHVAYRKLSAIAWLLSLQVLLVGQFVADGALQTVTAMRANPNLSG